MFWIDTSAVDYGPWGGDNAMRFQMRCLVRPWLCLL